MCCSTDILIGCTGGGSNFGGFTFPFLREKIVNGKQVRVIAVEPSAAPSLTRGVYAYDYGDTAKMAPMVKMHTLGHDFIPAPIHAGGLRYHGMSAQVSALKEAGLIEAVNVQQSNIFEAALSFTAAEGILPAPEPAHAIYQTMQEALRCKEAGESKTIVFNLCGHGHFDMGAYENYMAGKLEDFDYPEAAIQRSLLNLPKVG
jgi:tryptophan synthase beta chain